MATVETRLQEICLCGDAASLRGLLNEDPLILDRFLVPTPAETPLHIAILLGHAELVSEILKNKAGLGQVKICDQRGLCPLHLASAKGYPSIVRKLLEVEPDSRLRFDKDGRMPIHLAAANGHVSLLQDLLPKNKSFNQALTGGGETVLHVGVKHNQLEIVKFVLENCEELINIKDCKGNTALHIATAMRQTQIVKLLLEDNIEVNALNHYGYTALDMLFQYTISPDMEICNSLLNSGTQRALRQAPGHTYSPRQSGYNSVLNQRAHAVPQKIRWQWTRLMPLGWNEMYKKDNISTKARHNTLMIVSTVIAGAAFQTGLNPPGNKDTDYFRLFITFDAIALIASMCVILFLISGLPKKSHLATWILIIFMWIAVAFMALAFLMGAYQLLDRSSYRAFLDLLLFCWLIIIGMLLAYHISIMVMLLLRWMVNSCCLSCFGVKNNVV